MGSSRRINLTEADRALWASYAGRVRPLRGRTPPAPAPEPVLADRVERNRETRRVRAVNQPPLAVGAQPAGVDRASWNRLRTGKLPTVRTLDLHGHTAQRAFQALATFLHSAQAEGVRCVEVVTGQGSVLRRELPLWLNRPEFRGMILAAAHPHAANPGAVRLLLRRAR
jgi:DNA-nicking Smr family endonuclease